MGVGVAGALTAAGVDVYDDQGVGPAHLQSSEIKRAELGELDGAHHKDTNAICWASVPTHARWWKDGQFVSMLTMWEASTLPESFRETFHEFDLLMVPSDHNVELFSRYHPNVRKVNLGVDPADWHFVERRPPSGRFNFLIGGSGARKGTDLAHAAFRKVFGDGDWPGDGPEPWLIMKTPKLSESYERDDTVIQFAGPRVQMIEGRLTAQQEIDLYLEAHCYVQPSRGEGFGLQPLQAMAQGIPTILTDAHGHAGFAHLGMPVPAEASKAAYFFFGDAGDWWEPNFDVLCEWMSEVYDNYGVACEDARRSAGVIADEWTWAQTAEQFVASFDGELDVPFAGLQSFHVPEAKLFEVVTIKDFTVDIGGTMYRFKRGASHYEPADVKRVLFEGGVLDPVCIDGAGSGLAPEQAARAADYSASHAACHICGHTLNTDDMVARHALELGEVKDGIYALLREWPQDRPLPEKTEKALNVGVASPP